MMRWDGNIIPPHAPQTISLTKIVYQRLDYQAFVKSHIVDTKGCYKTCKGMQHPLLCLLFKFPAFTVGFAVDDGVGFRNADGLHVLIVPFDLLARADGDNTQ